MTTERAVQLPTTNPGTDGRGSAFARAVGAAKRALGMAEGAPAQRWWIADVPRLVAGAIVIRDNAGREHKFARDQIHDTYFMPAKHDPRRVDLWIWLKPSRGVGAYEQVYAGTFLDAQSEVRYETERALRELGLTG
jgi:hypothetical protein